MALTVPPAGLGSFVPARAVNRFAERRNHFHEQLKIRSRKIESMLKQGDKDRRPGCATGGLPLNRRYNMTG